MSTFDEYYVPPPGFERKTTELVNEFNLPFDDEYVLLRLPAEILPEDLEGKSLSDIINSHKFVKLKNEDLGEMRDMKLLIPDSSEGNIVLGPSFKSVYNLMPYEEMVDYNELVKVGERILNEAYVPKEELPNLKLQSLPFGFHTHGEALERVEERRSKKTKRSISNISAPSSDAAFKPPSKKHKKNKKERKDTV